MCGFGFFFLRELVELLDVPFADPYDGQHMIHDQSLRDDRLELVVDEINGIDFLTRVTLDDLGSQIARLSELDLVQDSDLFSDDLHFGHATVLTLFGSRLSIGKASTKQITALAADGNHID